MKLLEHFKELSLYPNNAEELKGLILQLAVQGKLTAKWREAHPNVEPASELLKRIEAEKQQLRAEKKIKKEKPLSPVGEDEIPFELPQGWAWSRFDEVILLQMGQSPPSISYNDEGIGEILINGPVEFSNGDYGITKEIKYTSAPTKMCNKGDLIVCIRASIGRTNIASNRACIGRGVASITSFIEFNYIHNYILINKATLFDLGTGTTFRSVSKDPIRNMLIPVPPLEEQKAIVEIVNTLFAEVEQLESLTKERLQLKESFVISALARLTEAENTQQEWNFLQQHFSSFFTEKKNIKSLRETILQLAVQGKLTHRWRENNLNLDGNSELALLKSKSKNKLSKRDVADLNQIMNSYAGEKLPENWGLGQLHDVALFWNGKAHESHVDENGKFILINSRFVSTNGKKIKRVRKNLSPLSRRDLAIVMSDVPNGRALSRCYVVDENDKYSLNQRIGGVTPEQGISSNYLALVLDRNPHYLAINDGMKQTNLKRVHMISCPIPFPPLEEQKAIVNKVSSLMALCDELEQQIESSHSQVEQLMQSCLQEVFEHESN